MKRLVMALGLALTSACDNGQEPSGASGEPAAATGDAPATAINTDENFDCRGTVSGTFANVFVPAGATCRLQRSTVNGNVLERAVLLGGLARIELHDLRFDDGLAIVAPARDSSLTLLEVERRHIELVLREENGHVERAARRLGIPRSSLYQKIKQLDLRPATAATGPSATEAPS